MKLTFSKKQKKIVKPKDEIVIHRVWVRIFSIFTVLHFVVLIGLSIFFRELIKKIDTAIEATPQTNLPALEVIDSKISTIETKMNTKTHSLLAEVKEEATTPDFSQ
jgi:hypothetical protein